jgi:hypothetical protein
MRIKYFNRKLISISSPSLIAKSIGMFHLWILLLVAVVSSCSNATKQEMSAPSSGPSSATVESVTTIDETQPLQSPTPEVAPEDLSTTEAKRKISEGNRIYRKIAARTGLPVIFRWRAAEITLAIPTREWTRLDKAEQIALSYFAESLIQEIRIDPMPFIRRWQAYYRRVEDIEPGMEFDGLNESSYINSVQSLCSSCWSITLGVLKRDGFYDDETVVSGATAREFRTSK